MKDLKVGSVVVINSPKDKYHDCLGTVVRLPPICFGMNWHVYEIANETESGKIKVLPYMRIELERVDDNG